MRARTPGKEHVVRVVGVQPGAPHREGLHALAPGGGEGVAGQGGHHRRHARLRAVAVVHVEVQDGHPPHPCRACHLSARNDGIERKSMVVRGDSCAPRTHPPPPPPPGRSSAAGATSRPECSQRHGFAEVYGIVAGRGSRQAGMGKA